MLLIHRGFLPPDWKLPGPELFPVKVSGPCGTVLPMSDTRPEPAPPAVTITVRIDPRALAVLDWYARYSGTPLRTRIREMLEADAVDISDRYNLPDTPPQGSALGRFAPHNWRNT